MASQYKCARSTLFSAIVLLLLGATAASTQQIFGRIFGTVTDTSGGAVANAKVTITDESKNTQFYATTNESGNYEKNQLIPGSYTVQVEAPGFAKQQFKDIVVQVDNAARVDSTLAPGNVSETVEVTTAAPTLQSGNRIPASHLSPQALSLLQYFPEDRTCLPS